MRIQRVSPFTNKAHIMDIPVTREQLSMWENGMLIQDAMPDLTPDQREFLKTGIMPDEWEQLFKED